MPAAAHRLDRARADCRWVAVRALAATLIGIAAAMAIAAPGRAAVTTPVLSSVPDVIQQDVLDGETASLQMALAHQGGHVTQAALLSRGRVSLAPPVLAGPWIVRWGDPFTSVDGSVTGQEVCPPTRYGTYAPTVARGARGTRAVGGDVLWSGTGLTLTRLEAAVVAGHPVVVWLAVVGATGALITPSMSSWRAWDGRVVPWAIGGGVRGHGGRGRPGARLLYDLGPWVGPRWVSQAALAGPFASFQGTAVELR